MGVNLFGGRFSSCVDELMETVNFTIVASRNDCEILGPVYNYTWYSTTHTPLHLVGWSSVPHSYNYTWSSTTHTPLHLVLGLPSTPGRLVLGPVYNYIWSSTTHTHIYTWSLVSHLHLAGWFSVLSTTTPGPQPHTHTSTPGPWSPIYTW